MKWPAFPRNPITDFCTVLRGGSWLRGNEHIAQTLRRHELRIPAATPTLCLLCRDGITHGLELTGTATLQGKRISAPSSGASATTGLSLCCSGTSWRGRRRPSQMLCRPPGETIRVRDANHERLPSLEVNDFFRGSVRGRICHPTGSLSVTSLQMLVFALALAPDAVTILVVAAAVA
jgi:hypothetical protein